MKHVTSLLALNFGLLVAASVNGATTAELLLQSRQAEFEKDVIQTAPNVYTAVGYGVSPSSMIIGDSGLIIIDTQIDATAAAEILTEFQKISDMPVAAIILTHGHGDHTGGAAVFAAAGDNVSVWARQGYGMESQVMAEAGLKIQQSRGARQGGFLLAPEQRINNGVARAYFPKRGGAVFGTADVAGPTDLIADHRTAIKVAGIELELIPATGETHDQLYVWLPENRVLFAGDNFYKSWPNLYAIRGTPYRDVLAWINSLTSMLDEDPAYLVGGHTRPISGEQEVITVLTNYRDAIKSIYDQTIAGMNRGLNPDELVEVVKLPEQYAELDYLREYYGNIEWSVRSIFNGYLGWFDGNPSNLFPLAPKDEAQRIARLAGGAANLYAEASSNLDADPQWTAQLCDYLLSLDYETNEVKHLKASALERIAEELLTATGRNYLLTSAQELRAE
jgi:alkyl sulfatase BDS1-like metallo-beta-lactamase superfamily hydrolase